MEKQVGMIYDEDKSGLAGEYEPKEHGQADAKAGQSPCCDRFPSALVHWIPVYPFDRLLERQLKGEAVKMVRNPGLIVLEHHRRAA
jgi:hypothetical protein